MSGQLATSETILVSAAGVIAADSAGLSSVKSYANLLTSIAALPLAGGTLTGNLLFNATNTYDIGNGTYDPRTVRAATSVLTPLVNNTNAAALIVGNSTYGISVPGRVTASGRITTYAGIVSSPTSASNNPATGVCDLLGTNPAIAWSEFGVDNRGVLGFASGSTTLSYRAGGANFTTYPGTEVFTIGSTGNVTCAGITASGVVSHGAYTVATLPAAGSNAGKMAQVTDSNVAASGNYGATVAAGGANRVKVFSDGTNWVIA